MKKNFLTVMNFKEGRQMKRRILSVIMVLALLFSLGFTSISASAEVVAPAEKQLYHLAIEDKLFGSYNWGGSGEVYPDNSMAAFYGWGARSIDSLYNGGGWSSSGVVVRVRNDFYVTALGDVYMDATKLSAGLGNRGESSFARKVQLWKINGITDVTNESAIVSAMAVLANWSKVAEVTVTPDKTEALAAGKGFNWTDLETPVLVSSDEVYVIVVEQGAGAAVGVWGNPRPNEINNVLAVHPDNMAGEIGQIASDTDFYMSGAPIGTFNVNPVDVQNALGGSLYSGGNFKYISAAIPEYETPVTSEITDTTAKITWTAAPDSEIFGNAGGYRVELSKDGEEPTIILVDGKDTVTLDLTDLVAGTEYTYIITAMTDASVEGEDVATYAAASFTTTGGAITPTVAPTSEPTNAPEDNAATGDSASPLLALVVAGLAIISVAARKRVSVN